MSDPKKPFNGKSNNHKKQPRKPAQPRPGLFLAGFFAASAAVGGAIFAINRLDEAERKKAAEAAERRAREALKKQLDKAPGKGFKFKDIKK